MEEAQYADKIIDGVRVCCVFSGRGGGAEGVLRAVLSVGAIAVVPSHENGQRCVRGSATCAC